MHRNSPFDPYLTRMKNEIETQRLRAEIHAHMTKDSPQFRRTRRFTQLIQYLLADFLPHDRDCRRRIEQHLIEAAFAGNCEIINVPPECDELDKLQLERRMLDMKAAPILSPPDAATPVVPCSATNEDVRWAVNVLLEQIAAIFDGWATFDLFRSEAAATVRSFKHDLSSEPPQTLPRKIAAIYGNLDAEDCATVDREWARQRGYILPTDGTSQLTRPAPQAAPTREEFLPQDAWNDLVHKDDRTSPKDYPDMCLISFGELKDYMERHTGNQPQRSAAAGNDEAAKLINQYLGMSDIDAEDVEYFRAVLRDTEPQRSAGDVDDLIDRLRNPMWAHGNIPFESPQLAQKENLAAMNEAAAEIERLRSKLKLSDNLLDGLTHIIEGLKNELAEADSWAEPQRSSHSVKAPFSFRRYVNGVEMAEGVEISNATTVQEAFAKARAIYGRPAGMDLVLEHTLDEPQSMPVQRWRHKKRGTTYTVVGNCEVQAEEPLTDHEVAVVYRSEQDGRLWVRRKSEFNDGRFEALPSSPLTREKTRAADVDHR